LILPEQVQRKPSADLDNLAGKGRPANPDQKAGNPRDDRRRHHPPHNLSTASVLMGCRKDKDLKIQLTEYRRNTVFVHGISLPITSSDTPLCDVRCEPRIWRLCQSAPGDDIFKQFATFTLCGCPFLAQEAVV
jgi:hypothetical protein